MTQELIILRYGHREVRDYRVTSHCALVSRALGAKEIIICGEKDESSKKSVDDVTSRWGGPFKVSFSEDWKQSYKQLKKKGFIFVHLTMYGIGVEKKEQELRKHKKIAIIVGSQKVEREVYDKADYNIAITGQPHSEIAALAVFLDRIQEGQENGKKVISLKTVGGRK